MSAKSKNIKSNLKKIAKYTIKSKEYDELPELTDDMFARATYKIHGITRPSPKKRGPQKTPTKIAVSLRLPRDVIAYFKSGGSGWQTKISVVLKNWVKQHSHSHR